MGAADIKNLQEQLTKVQEVLASIASITHSLMHDSQARDLTQEYDPLTRGKRYGLYLAQKNLLLMAEGEIEQLGGHIRRYTRAYSNLKTNQPQRGAERDRDVEQPNNDKLDMTA